MAKSRFDSTLLILMLTTLIATLGTPVNPYPTDGWYQTQYLLFDSFPGRDDYTPIAAPALLYRGAHALATYAGVGLAGEFYIASVLQNVLLLLSAYMVGSALSLMQFRRLAAPVSIGLLLCVLSTGLPQAFWSENVTLFLTTAVLQTLALLLYGTGKSRARFWALSAVCGLLIGLLVVTRMTPIFMIPAVAMLFYRRLPLLQVVQCTGALALITVLMMASMILANHARFGRYELTNSSGRHLWQGVKEISDRTLASSSEYQALKKLDPDLQGKNWWELPPVPQYRPVREYVPPTGYVTMPGYVPADPREPVLAKLSKQAIGNAPGLYLMQGVRKFVRSIGSAPYRLGFDTFGVWNPLDRTEFLPSPASLMGLPRLCSQFVDVAFRGIYAIFRWLYPITIFAIVLSCIARTVEWLDAWRRRRSPSASAKSVMPIAVFGLLGAPCAVIPLASYGLAVDTLAGSACCFLLLVVGASILRRRLPQGSSVSPVPAGFSCLFVLTLLYFGSLWFSWQIEAANPRNILPLLPIWSILIAIAGTSWKDLWAPRAAFGLK